MKSLFSQKNSLILCCFAATLLVSSGCRSGIEAELQQQAIVDSIQRQPGWQPDPSNPIIQAGDFMDKGLWNDPHVLKEGTKYIMYMTSSSPKNPFKPPILPYRAVSDDGENWHLDPPNALMDPSSTPFVSIETPSVVKFNGVYHMFYTGVYPDGAPNFAIGHAVSKDGIHWDKDPTEAIKPTGNPTEWNGFIVGEPGAVIYNNTIYVYFSAAGQVPGGKPPLDQSIGYVITQDGKTFSAPKIALKLAPEYPRSKNFSGYSTPSAVVKNGTIHLFHDITVFSDDLEPNWQQVGIGHAYSTDGGQTFLQDKQTIFVRNDFDWTRGEIRAPSALFDNGKLHLWFAGMVSVNDFRNMINRGIKGREFGIGHATIDASQLSGNH